eukprot:COSAG04_NODE_3246_length_3009_cov_13.038288_1_plen_203_part_10
MRATQQKEHRETKKQTHSRENTSRRQAQREQKSRRESSYDRHKKAAAANARRLIATALSLPRLFCLCEPHSGVIKIIVTRNNDRPYCTTPIFEAGEPEPEPEPERAALPAGEASAFRHRDRISRSPQPGRSPTRLSVASSWKTAPDEHSEGGGNEGDVLAAETEAHRKTAEWVAHQAPAPAPAPAPAGGYGAPDLGGVEDRYL